MTRLDHHRLRVRQIDRQHPASVCQINLHGFPSLTERETKHKER